MKISKCVKEIEPSRKAVEKFITKYDDEVYTRKEICEQMQISDSRLKEYLRQLRQEEKIFHYAISSTQYLYGNRKAVDTLRRKLSENQKSL